jgi:hypothetical protein
MITGFTALRKAHMECLRRWDGDMDESIADLSGSERQVVGRVLTMKSLDTSQLQYSGQNTIKS